MPVSFQKLKRKVANHHKELKIFLVVFFLLAILILAKNLFKPVSNILGTIFFAPKVAISALNTPVKTLANTANRTNILLLGMPGGSHDGQDLTDTIIFVSIDLASADTVMISIPRDIWLDSLKAKINTAYHYGEIEKSGGGIPMIKDSVYQILNQPIHYVFAIDFESFVQTIDLLGGVDIKVEQAFDDYQYPIAGKENDPCDSDPEYKCRYEHLRFESGLQHMAGTRALKFARSRHAVGTEGSDFARSARQQKVMLAIKNKLLSTSTLLNPGKIRQIQQTFSSHLIIDPQLSDAELGGFVNLFFKFSFGKKNIRTISLDEGTEENPGFLISPPIEKYEQWVLVPRNETWQQFQEYFKAKLANPY